MEKLRVAMGTVFPINNNKIRGGVEAVSLYLATALARRSDIDLHIVSCNSKVEKDFIETRNGYTIHWIKIPTKMWMFRTLVLDCKRVQKIYEIIDPDVIHSQMPNQYALGAPDNKPFALTLHGFESFSPAYRFKYKSIRGIKDLILTRWMISHSISKADAVISIAGNYLESTLGKIVYQSHIYKINNPIDASFFTEIKPIPDGQQNILYVGGILERKNLLSLVKAFADVLRTHKNAILQVAGPVIENEYYKKVKKEIDKNGINNYVNFLGELSQTELLSVYDRSSVVVLPSIQETSPMCIAQAMARGRAVIASPIGGIIEMIEEGKNGYFVEFSDVTTLSLRLTKLLSSREILFSMGKQGRIKAEQMFTPDIVAQKIMDMYQKIV